MDEQKKELPAHQPGTSKGEEVAKKEGKEAGRYDTTEDGANRPSGKSTGRDSSAVAPSDPIDPKSPNLQAP